MPHARVEFLVGGQQRSCEGQGDGPVDATVNAIESAAASGAELVLFSVNAISTGTQSQGEVTMRLSRDGRIVNGVGCRPGHHRRLGQGVPVGLEQAAREG